MAANNQYVGKILTANEILESDEKNWDNWCEELLTFVEDEDRPLDQETINGYKFSWKDCFCFLKQHLPSIDGDIPFLFEYRPSLFGGHRTDVIILLDTKVIVLEFKATKQYEEREITQLNQYIHFLKTSHDITVQQNLNVEGFLVRTKDKGEPIHCETGIILTVSNFKNVLLQSLANLKPYVNVNEWINSKITILPAIQDGLVDLWENGDSKELQSLKDGDFGKILPKVSELISNTQKNQEKSVIIVDGVPGSGKTYLGMDVFFNQVKAARTENKNSLATYVSGNAALISYFKELFSREISNDLCSVCSGIIEMRDFKDAYLFKKLEPQYNMIVFDESQRMWDEKKMKKDFSEVEALLRIGDQTKNVLSSCVILCLYGSGQTIYVGEENGPEIWEKAINAHPDWNYFSSSEIAKTFHCENKIKQYNELHLSTSIRNHYIDISPWIEAFIDNKSKKIQKGLLNEAKKKGFSLYVTRDWKQVRTILNQGNATDYGAIVSSFLASDKLRQMTDDNIKSSYLLPQQAGKWFLDDAEKLKSAVTEFACQGLELDWPIVLFGGDLRQEDGKWLSEIPKNKSKDLQDPEKILRCIYRVLLSRGREGLIIVISKDSKMDETYQLFLDIGAIPM